MHGRYGSVERFLQVLLLGLARGLSWLEAVVAVGQPVNPNCRRQLVPSYLFAIAKRVAFALENQRRRLDGLKMLDPQLRGLAHRVKRVAQADQSSYASFHGDETGNPTAHRLAADHQPVRTYLFDHL